MEGSIALVTCSFYFGRFAEVRSQLGVPALTEKSLAIQCNVLFMPLNLSLLDRNTLFVSVKKGPYASSARLTV